MAEPQEHGVAVKSCGAIRTDGLVHQVADLKRLCAAMPDCDGVGKLRGKLARLEGSLEEFHRSGNATAFRADLGSLTDLVRRLHTLDPLAQLLHRLSALTDYLGGSLGSSPPDSEEPARPPGASLTN
jgi:hypothetical protein